MHSLAALKQELRLLLEQVRDARLEDERRPKVEGRQPTSKIMPFNDEVDELIESVLVQVSKAVPLRDLDERAAKREHIDLEPVWAVVELLRKLGASQWSFQYPTRVEKGAVLLERLEAHRTSFDQVQKKHGPAEAGLRVWLGLDGALFNLLFLAAHAGVDLASIERLVQDSTAELQPEEIATIWRSIQREVAVDPDEDLRFPLADELVPPGFFGLATSNELAKRIAHYVVILKPKAVLWNSLHGNYSHPIDAPGVAALLARKGGSAELSAEDERLLAGVVRLMSVTPEKGRAHRAGALGLSEDAWVCRRPNFVAAKKVEVSAEHALRITERILLQAEARTTAADPIEAALLHYKLGLEVTRHESVDAIKGQHELVLQRRVCKFLIEHGVRAYGTTFDNSETDILAQAPNAGEAYIIEVKVYRSNSSVTKAKIEKHLRQLQKYVDQHYQGSRGVLFIFNLSNTPIKAERVWFARQYRVISINLGSLSPSNLEASMEIVAATDGALIEVITSAPRSTPKRTKRKTRKGKVSR